MNQNYNRMKYKFDFFKFFLLIILLGFLYVFYLNSQNGRYINYNQELEKVIIDTRTGALYAFTDDKLIQVLKPIKIELRNDKKKISK